VTQDSLALELLLAPSVVMPQPAFDVVPALLIEVGLAEHAKVTQRRVTLNTRPQLRITVARVTEQQVVADMLAMVLVQGINYIALPLNHRKRLAKDFSDIEGGPSALRQDKHVTCNGFTIGKVNGLNETFFTNLTAGDLGAGAQLHIASRL
jgi:hypothetical protein